MEEPDFLDFRDVMLDEQFKYFSCLGSLIINAFIMVKHGGITEYRITVPVD